MKTGNANGVTEHEISRRKSPGPKYSLLNEGLKENIKYHLPKRLQLQNNWNLCYSLGKHGASLNTLFSLLRPPREGSKIRMGYVLVIEAKGHRVLSHF